MYAVLQHLGQLVQEPLLGPLRYILQNYPKLLLQASYTRCAPGGAADLFAQIQYQVQQVSLCTMLMLSAVGSALICHLLLLGASSIKCSRSAFAQCSCQVQWLGFDLSFAAAWGILKMYLM